MKFDKIESVEVFSNSAGTRVLLHLRKPRTLSDESISVDNLPLPVQNALLKWLEESE